MNFGRSKMGILQIGDERFAVKPISMDRYLDGTTEIKVVTLGDMFVHSNALLRKKKITDEIRKVIFNNPVTVVIWADGTKTVVKCQPGDEYSRETGLAMCIAKKYFGNKGNFNEVFKKFIEGYDLREVNDE